MTDTRTCPQCGKTYGADDRFCTVDGAALVAAAGLSIVGTVIADRFLVQEKLGEGGMGEVYLAEHVRMKRKVALKLMRPWMIGDPVAVGRFHREAENASQISHPNVAQVYDFGETADRMVYLAMEFVDGEPLSAVLQREGTLHIVRTAEIVRQVAEALVAAHAMGILHRDLKPDNVMVARARHGTDVVKLVDFGIARAMNRATQQFTSTGLVVGTPDYMSPEQLSGDELDGRSDLYALALMAYRMLCGGGAYSDSSSGESLVSRLTGKPRPLESWQPDIPWPPRLQAAFARALAPDPNERFADPLAFAAELEAAIMEMPLGEAEQAYLIALAQRHPTPGRGALALEGMTPTQGVGVVPTPLPSPASATSVPVTPTAVTAPMSLLGGATQPSSAATGPRPVLTESGFPARGPARAGKPWLGLAGGVALLAAAVWAMQGDRPTTTAPHEPVASESLTVAPPAAKALPQPVPPATPAAAGVPAARDGAALTAARRATLAVWAGSGGRRGAAVLLGPDGIALTAATLVPSDSAVDVFLSPDVRVRASVLAIDRAAGLATLHLPLDRCARCQPMAVAAADPTAGDSVLVLPSAGREDGREVEARVTAVNGRTLTLADMPRNATGASLVSHQSGQVVGLIDGTRVIGPTALGDAIARARRLAAGRRASAQLVPIWPARAVPRERMSGDGVDQRIESYRIAQKDLVLLAMTPPVMRRRADVAADPVDLTAAKDPIAKWSGWQPTLGERRAVVVLYASHKDATFLRWPSRDANLRNADAAIIQLYRGDSLVAPIDRARIPSLTSNGTREIPTAAVASYSALEFRDRSAWRVQVMDAQGKVLLNTPVPIGTLEAIRRDFAWLY